MTQNSGVLRRDIKLFASEKQGTWTLFDPVADRYFRLGEKEYNIISRLHGNTPINHLLEQMTMAGIEVDEKKLKELLVFLSTNGLMQPVYELTEKRILNASAGIKKMKKKQLLSSWLFFRIPLISPDRFLTSSWPYVKVVFNKKAIILFGLLALLGYLFLITRWHHITAIFMSTLTGGGLLRYGLTIVIIKIVHELAHAYAAKAAGVRVRRIGIAIMVFMPRLYTDITDSWQIKDKKTKLLIDGAGMGLEVIIGGLAAFIWVSTGAGTLNSICYYLLAVTSLNTLLVNGNPLLRFDGYYLLMDGTGIDNLYSRASLTAKNFMRRNFFGIQPTSLSPNMKQSTEIFLVCYGVCAYLYKIFLYTSILLIIYFKFTKTIALLLIALELYVLILQPLITEIKAVMRQRHSFQTGRASITLVIVISLFVALLIPLPWNLEIGCITMANKAQVLHVAEEGYLKKLQAQNNTTIRLNDALYSMSNPHLDLKRKHAELTIDLVGIEEDQLRNTAGTIGLSRIKQQYKKSLENVLLETDRKISLLNVTAPMDGMLWWYKPDEMIPGRWLARGEALGEVFNTQDLGVIGCLPEYELGKIQKGQKARIYLPDRIRSISGVVIAVNPAPVTKSGPSPILSTFGGPIPAIKDKEKYRILNPYYEVIIKPDNSMELSPGRTGTVRLRRFSSIAGGFARTLLQLIR